MIDKIEESRGGLREIRGKKWDRQHIDETALAKKTKKKKTEM
jgi:hypothetical protein